jgi:Flp pilus assembly protein TadG
MNCAIRRPVGIARRNARRGGALVEAALVLPLIIMLGFGAIDYSDYFFLKNSFQGAANAGARAAIPSSAANSNVTGIISTMLGAAGITSNKYSVTLSPTNVATVSAGSNITVTITGNWGTCGTHMLSTTLGGIGNSKQIVGAAVMQKEP